MSNTKTAEWTSGGNSGTWNTNLPFNLSDGPYTVNTNATLTLAQIQAHTPVLIAKETIREVYAVAVDDNTIKFYSQGNDGTEVYQNSTVIGWNDFNNYAQMRTFVIIDSVTSY